MPTIVRQDVIDQTSMYVPAENLLTNDEMLVLADDTITYKVTEDDTAYMAEAKCKFLQALASVNKAITVNNVGLRRDKQLDSELEYFSRESVWEDFANSLKDVCPLFGYTGLGNKFTRKITVVTRDTCPVNPWNV